MTQHWAVEESRLELQIRTRDTEAGGDPYRYDSTEEHNNPPPLHLARVRVTPPSASISITGGSALFRSTWVTRRLQPAAGSARSTTGTGGRGDPKGFET